MTILVLIVWLIMIIYLLTDVFRLFWMHHDTGKQSWVARFNIVGRHRGPDEVCQVSSYLKDLRVSPPSTTHAHIKCGDNSVKFGTSLSSHCIKSLPLTVSCTVYSRFNQPTNHHEFLHRKFYFPTLFRQNTYIKCRSTIVLIEIIEFIVNVSHYYY